MSSKIILPGKCMFTLVKIIFYYDYDYDLGVKNNLRALLYHLFYFFEIFVFIMPEEKIFIKAIKII